MKKKMDWFQSKTTQIIALVGIVSTLAGFGYTGAGYVNRISNLENKMVKSVAEIEGLTDQLVGVDRELATSQEQLRSLDIEVIAEQIATIDKQVATVTEQIRSLNVETEDLTPIKEDITALQTSVAGLNASVDIIYADVQSLKNINDNPLAN